MMPEHYVIQHAKQQDYFGFYEVEIRHRYLTSNPPFYFYYQLR